MATKKTEAIFDRRIQRTRETLRHAFMQLLKDRDWDQIRVQDICDLANVGRSTFYNHYVDKEGLLVGGLSDLGDYIRSNYAKRPGAPALWFARGILDHASMNEDMFRVMQSNKSGAIIQARFRQLASELARECLVEQGLKGHWLEAGAHFLGGAFMELFNWYGNLRKRPSIDDLEALFHDMSKAVVERG